MSKKILLFYHGGSENRGCEAIVRTAVTVIKKKYPDSYIALASRKPETDQHIPGLDKIILHNTNRGLSRFSLDYFKNQWETRVIRTFKTSYRLMHQDIAEAAKDFDIVLSIGGDNYCYGETPDIYELDRQIKSLGKKLILWGASVGAKDVCSNAMRKDLESLDALLIREPNSYEELKGLGFNNVHLVADGAFLLDKEFLPLPKEWEEGNTIGFNYSPLVHKKHPESRKAALELLKHILNTTSYKIALTPHVIISGNDDYACMLDLLKDLKNEKGVERIFALPNNLNAIQIKGYIARMELFIGARTHATIAAYSSCVPTMVLGYSIKSLGIAKDLFGTERLVLKSDEISNAELLKAKFDELNRDKVELKMLLEQRIPEIKLKSLEAANYI